MGRVVEVAKLTADGSQAQREFRETGKQGEEMARRIREGANSMSPALRAVDASAGVARQKVEAAAGAAGSLGTVLRALGPVGLAAAAGVGAAALAFNALNTEARAATDTLGEIYTASSRLNVSVGFLQEFRYAMVQTGEDARIVDASLGRLGVKLGEVRTGLGEDAVRAFAALGFSRDQILRFEDIEELLPEIAERIANLGSAAERAAIAEKLGLREMLPLLEQGSDALARARQEARDLGIVLDEETVRRARELGGAWDAAAYALDITFKQAMIDAAPLFIDTLKFMRDLAQAASDFADQFQRVEDRSTRFVRNQLSDVGQRQFELVERYGNRVTQGGSAAAGQQAFMRGGVLGLDTLAANLSFEQAQNQFAFLQARGQRLVDELARRDASITLPGSNGNGSALGLGSPARPDATANQLRTFVERLREEAEERTRIAAAQREYPKDSRAELEARAELAESIEKLREARERGVIASDEELTQLTALAQKGYDLEAAERRYAEALAQRAEVQRSLAGYRESIETPLQAMERQRRDLQKLYDESQALGPGALTQDELARGLERIADEYRDIRAAQFEASLAGELLVGVWNQQIRSAEDLLAILVRIAGDAVLRELLTGNMDGGVGGFASRVFDRIGQSVTGSDEGWGSIIGSSAEDAAGQVEKLATSAAAAAAEATKGLTPSLADAASKALISGAATAAETGAKNAGTASLAVMTKAANVATGAIARMAAAADAAAAGDGGETGANLVKSLVSSFTKGGGMMGGGRGRVGSRYDYRESGPELMLLGGEGEVFGHDAVQGLQMMARMGRMAQPSAAPIGGGGRVQIINESGVALEASEASMEMDSDGMASMRVVVRRMLNAEIVDGNVDSSMRGRFNAKRQRVKR